ncbi:MAG TPA: glycosyltransferase family 2 protein [Acetobacteraceae bacterium]|nr:glycosyltransferase family 2 protein [Acetobacteraceae bacterium]
MPTSQPRLCLLTPESTPPGPDCAGLFLALRKHATTAGYRVTEAAVSETGIRILGPEQADPAPLPQRFFGPAAAQAAYRVLEWLRAEPFDIVCAPAEAGLLFYALAARHQAVALTGTTFCVLAERLTLLSRHRAGEMPRDMEDLVRDEMERRMLALPDAVLVTDSGIAPWVREQGWTVAGLRDCGDTPQAAVQALWPDLLAAARRAAPPADADGDMPLVSVCIPHFNRPTLLWQAVSSIRAQTYPRIELVVVDDASTDPAALATLDTLEAELAEQGGKLVRHPVNRYLGAARNTGARHASGAFVLFLDDDDYAKPEQVATLVRAAQATGADIVNSLCERLQGQEPPKPGQQSEERWLTLGNVPTLGLFRNLFGTASALFRKTSFERLGGFTEMHGIGCEDWEIFARASLAGMNLQTVPEALYWYRLTQGSMIQTGNVYAGESRAMAPYLALVPQVLWPALRFAHGAEQRLQTAQDSLRHGEAVLRHRDALIAHRERHIAHLTQLDRERAEPLAALSREVAELRAVLRVTMGGYGPTPQSAVDSMLQSGSWRLGRLLQAPLRWMRGRPETAPPRVTDWVQAASVINSMQRSTTWEMTGLLRALAGLLRRR